MKKEQVKPIFENKFLNVYDLQWKEGMHYYNASRRKLDDLVAVKKDHDFKEMIPDAVSCVVILEYQKKEKLLLDYEFRYPAGQFLLSVPAGLIDPKDQLEKEPLIATAIREIKEETGIDVKEQDEIRVINPCLFSTPGMSDETNGIVLAKIHLEDLTCLSQDGAEGTEMFNGFVLLDKQQAKQILLAGRDEKQHFYSVYTWIALASFVGDLFK